MSARLKSLLEERATAWETTGKPLASKDDWTADERATWENLETRLQDLDSKIDRENSIAEQEKRDTEARSKITGLGTGTPDRGDTKDDRDKPLQSRKAYIDAFTAWATGRSADLTLEQRQLLNGGQVKVDEGEARAQSIGTGTAGGYLVPQGFYNVLTKAMKAYGSMVPPDLNFGDDDDGGFSDGVGSAGTTKLMTDTGNPLPMPSLNDTNNVGARLAENAQITGQDMTFGQTTLNAWIYTSKLILVPWTLLQDSAFDLNTWIPQIAGQRIGRILNTELTTGTGSGNSMPNGVVTAATAGVTLANGTTTITSDNLIDLEHSVDPAYRRNGKYMMNDLTLAVVRKLKDSQNRPLWEPSLQVEAPSLFAGKPYVVNNDVPVQAAGGVKFLLFGDFSTYFVRVARSASLIKLEERYADYLQTGFFVWCRADGNQMDAGTHPIKALVQT